MDVTEFGGRVNTSSMEYGLPRSLPGVNSFVSVKIGKRKGEKKHQDTKSNYEKLVRFGFVILLVQLIDDMLLIIFKLAC